MPQLSDVNIETAKFMGIFMGATKSGKKTAIASFPKPIYIFDLDGRINGIKGSNHVSTDGITYDYYPPNDKAITFDRITNQLRLFQQKAQQGQLEYQTIAFCSFTGLTRNFMLDSVRLTHEIDIKTKTVIRGNYLDKLELAGPEDYKYESTATSNIVSYLRGLPCHVIISAHMVPIFGKPLKKNGEPDQFAESIKTGERIHLRDKISADILIYFDHVFSFKKQVIGDRILHKVRFRGENEGTTFVQLPDGEVEITNIPLYPKIMERIKNATSEK